ncbi:TetR family transcriptional regulator [Nocardia tenerifensis]|uniref:TetR family transcriptional regulator n=1 Tax=Nocardia tenerifensis TaxID=228006 RepID=A0A318JVD1_9NOCA|nr:TetR/AcrR family transcriptional regulator [Nocardia tenerifensis]PXX56602.1 TetR family transcriptional regulator [Nocardia tenerifensis]
MSNSTKVRMTATERGEQVLRAAVSAFAEGGYAATRTDEIARRAGVSQPYVIRLFHTKQALFIAALHRVCDRIEEVFRTARAAAEPDASPEDALNALGNGFDVFLADREMLQLFLHGFAASGDPAIGDEVRTRFGDVVQLVRDLSGADIHATRQFISTGMLLTVMSAMQVTGPDAPTWAIDLLNDCTQTED